MQISRFNEYREFLRDTVRKTFDFSTSDQSQGVPMPLPEKAPGTDQKIIPLLSPADLAGLSDITLQSAINNRESRRRYTKKPVSEAELSFLLWATQGVRQIIGGRQTLRTVPSAGARHALETYLAISNVNNLEDGFYRYLPLSHNLVALKLDGEATQKVARAALNQRWMADAAIIFIWATIPYRMEWRYGPAAHRAILIDAGHVCQNLYLACEAINAGTCAVAAYDQQRLDRLLELDGVNEFAIYTAAVGKII